MSNEIWLTIEEVSELTQEVKETVRRKCKRGEYVSKHKIEGKRKLYFVQLNSLPESTQENYFNKLNPDFNDVAVIENNAELYAKATITARKQADKYLELINLTKYMKHSAIIEFLQDWNEKYPDKKSSYASLHRAKTNYKKFGISALLSKKGIKQTKPIDAKYFEYYKSLYLKEGAPSAFFCWQVTLGYAKKHEDFDASNFPSYKTFDRHLKKEIPKQAIYLARYGQAAWNKKYATYIPRDYLNIKAGSCWVSDHAQIDVAVDFNGTTYFPWVTVFRDVKTSKWLGWFLHLDAPNSDHIFQTFYYAVQKFGIPNDVYLDNGKDYRCKDFAGGRHKPCVKGKGRSDELSTCLKPFDGDVGTQAKPSTTGARKQKARKITVQHFKDKENSLLRNLGIDVHFALPYNAQTKPIERDFLKVKTFMSKGFVGYRGGKITERPEKLKNEIKNNKIMPFDEFKTVFDDFIENYLNKKPSGGKVLQGKSPDELWAEEFKVKKVISKDALKLFCMRTSKDVKISRNGIYDSQFGVTYWADWMVYKKGIKVFMRRDVNAYQEAWVFDAQTQEFLGKANTFSPISFLAKTNVEKAIYKKALAIKKKEQKILKSFINTKYQTSNVEIVKNLVKSLDEKEFNSKVKVSKIANTSMDKIVQNERKNDYMSKLEENNIKPIFKTESEKRRWEEMQSRLAENNTLRSNAV